MFVALTVAFVVVFIYFFVGLSCYRSLVMALCISEQQSMDMEDNDLEEERTSGRGSRRKRSSSRRRTSSRRSRVSSRRRKNNEDRVVTLSDKVVPAENDRRRLRQENLEFIEVVEEGNKSGH